MFLKKRQYGVLAATAILLILVIAFSVVATAALRPHRDNYGCLWKQYLQEPENSLDVLFLGTSIAYTDMIPAVIYRQSGLTSFSMAGPEQSMTESYYYLREATKTQSPKLVVLEVTGLLLDNEPDYDFINIDSMPQGLNRLQCMAQTVPSNEWIKYMFPLWVYHSRWAEVSEQEIRLQLEPASPDLNGGWTVLREVKAFDSYEPKLETYTEKSFQTGAEALRRIVDYCREQDISLLLCMSPRCNVMKPETVEKLHALLDTLDADFADFDLMRDQIGIDDQTDFYDNSHLNVFGAEKFSCYLANYFVQTCAISPADAPSELWDARVQHYEDLRAALG